MTDSRTLKNRAYVTGIRLGRAFTSDDVTPELLNAARVYATEYDGTFAWMLNARQEITANPELLPQFARGILNCLVVDGSRRLSQRRRENGRTTHAKTAVTPVAQPVKKLPAINREQRYQELFGDD